MQPLRKSSFLYSVLVKSAWISIVSLALIATHIGYSWSERQGYAYLDAILSHRLELYAAGMESELAKHEYLPGLLELDPDVLRLLTTPDDAGVVENVNRHLTSLSVRSGSTAIFLTDADGVVRASSNWYQPQTFVGQDFSSAPMIADAIDSGRGRYFSHDNTSNSPEYFFAQPIRPSGTVIGVAVVKISLAPIVSSWLAGVSHTRDDKFLIIDEHNVIVISSEPGWKYKKTILSSAMQKASRTRTEGQTSAPIFPLGMFIERPLDYGNVLLRLPAENASLSETLYVAQERYMIRPGWRVVTFSRATDVQASARYAAAGAGAVVAFAGLLCMHLLHRHRAVAHQLAAREALQRAHDELEQKVAERTAILHQTNKDLLREIAEHKQTTQILRETQNDLIQASKLTLLGQIAAGITHEINQPLTALRSLSHNAQQLLKRGHFERIEKTLRSIADLTDRMSQITDQLKSFVQKAPPVMGPVSLTHAVESALLLMENRIRTDQVDVRVDVPRQLIAQCNSNRIEQVLINLFANAMDAMQDAPSKVLWVEARRLGDRAVVRVRDSGPGISEDAITRLFEPFFSTKAPGKGVGLGLAISAGIVHEFGGTLRAENIPGGAVFEFDLKLTEANDNV